jgi:hypothetical protein
VWHTGRPCGAGVFKYVKWCGLPSNEEVKEGTPLARQTEIVNCCRREYTPAAIIIKANIHILYE